MDQTLAPRPQRRTLAPLAWIAATTFAALTLALIIAQLTHAQASTGPTQLRLPAAVTAQNCTAVAKGAHLLKTPMTSARVGTYYAAWVNKLAGATQPTRSTLFNAGIAVAVCLR